MKKLSKQRALLFAVCVGLCASAMPSAASAASWGVIGTTHTLDWSNLSFSAPALGVSWSCTATAAFDADVRSASLLTVTNASAPVCVGRSPDTGCTVTENVTKHMTLLGTTTSNVTTHFVDIHVKFETVPPGGGMCTRHNKDLTATGELGGGVWDAAAHQVTYASDSGLTIVDDTTGAVPLTVTGMLRDTQQTLTLT